MPCTFKGYCNGCPYRNAPHLLPTERRLPLSMEHNPGTTALLIFLAPGINEWRKGQPICSESSHSAAAKIRNSLRRINVTRGINLSRYNFSITNSVQCYPGTNRKGRDKPPTEATRRQCANWLKNDIDSRRWRRIVVFGQIAEKSVRYLAWRTDGFTFHCRRKIPGCEFWEESVRWHRNGCNLRFCFVPHLSSTHRGRHLSDDDLEAVLCWALGIEGD